MRKARQLVLIALGAWMAAAVAFASGDDESGSQTPAAAAEMMAEYGDVWQWDTLQDYEQDTGNKITQFGEAPMLAIQVAAGELPPVEERLPEEPLVFNVFEGIGTYGGTLKAASIGTEYTELTPIRGLVGAVQTANRGPGHVIDIVPYIHKGWEMSEDQKTVTMYLRRGMKWSDGHPYTADDVMFSFEDFLLLEEFPSGWRRNGWGPMSHAEKVDDFTVRLHYSDPFPDVAGLVRVLGRLAPPRLSQALPFQVSRQVQRERRRPGQGGRLRQLGAGGVAKARRRRRLPGRGPEHPERQALEPRGDHHHLRAPCAQSLSLRHRPGRQPAPLHRPPPGGDGGRRRDPQP